MLKALPSAEGLLTWTGEATTKLFSVRDRRDVILYGSPEYIALKKGYSSPGLTRTVERPRPLG